MNVEELIDNFEYLEEWEDRYRYLIDLGRKLPPLDQQYKTPDFIVPGCMSQVWMTTQVHEGESTTLEFIADSDAHIVKGLIAVLLIVFSNKTPEQILATNIEDVFGQLGLEQHLSPNRRNGFFSMVERIKTSAAIQQNATPDFAQ